MNAYMPVPFESSLSKDLFIHAVDTMDWIQYYNFVVSPVPNEMLGQDDFLVNLGYRRKFRAGVLRMDPNTCYNWHTDTDRRVGINMLLSDDGGSRCLFLDGVPGVVFKTKELKYEADTYYVFNTQVPHMVLNTTEPRYMFSLEFLDEDRGLTFDELCADIKGMDHGY